MTGRVIIVTGASSGLGYEVARYLCEGGNDVILACRSEEKGIRAIEKIKRQNPNALATFMHLDLASMESINKFVQDFNETEKSLHVLVNNAGVAMSPKDTKRQFTKDNFELTMGTNHLGHFLLTNLLLDSLKKTGGEENGDARVITVTSSIHDPEANRRKNLQPLDLDNFFLFNKGTYNGLQAYKNSKAANIMFTYELARRLEGSGVTANAICPGFVPGTDLMRNASGTQKFFSRFILHGMLRFTKMTRSVSQGAQAICNLITEEKWKGVSGKYVKDGAEAKSSEETLDEEKQKKVWELSGGYVHLEGYEPIEVTPPPPEEEEKPKKEKKDEKKEDGEAQKDGEAKPVEGEAGEGDNKTDETKTEEQKKEGDEEEVKKESSDKEEIKKEDEAKEEKKEEKKEEEKTEEKTEEKKEESSEKTEAKEQEEKKE